MYNVRQNLPTELGQYFCPECGKTIMGWGFDIDKPILCKPCGIIHKKRPVSEQFDYKKYLADIHN